MKITIESTPDITDLDGVMTRVWQGTTEHGVKCLVDVVVVLAKAPEFEDYFVGDDGRILSLRGQGKRRRTRGLLRRLKPIPRPSWGYLSVSLCTNTKRVIKRVHHLVLEAFVGPSPDGLEARHLDGDKFHNHIDNLCWGTTSENRKDAIRHGTLNFWGERHPMAKLSFTKVRLARELLRGGMSQQQVANQLGVTQTTISRLYRKECWSHVKDTPDADVSQFEEELLQAGAPPTSVPLPVVLDLRLL